MKCADDPDWYEAGKSPSMRREWIEIFLIHLAPHGFPSPSMRREWIEILCGIFLCFYRSVSLHAEGVD